MGDLVSAGQIARDLRLLGRYEESSHAYRGDRAIQPLFENAEHREIVRLRTDYAMTLRRLGRLDAARAEAELCLAVNQRRFGSTHNYTLAAMSILAEVLRLLGRADQALELAERVAGQRHPVMGPGMSSSRPWNITSRSGIAPSVRSRPPLLSTAGPTSNFTSMERASAPDDQQRPQPGHRLCARGRPARPGRCSRPGATGPKGSEGLAIRGTTSSR